MKKFTQATLIALLLSSSVFSQTKDVPGRNNGGATSVNQAANSRLVLLSPSDGKSFNSSDASKPVIFRWTAVVPKPKEAVTYRLKVWQLMQGQNGTEAMRSNQPIVTKDVDNITQSAISNLYTGPCRPPYLCDYVWAVEVINRDAVSIDNSHAGSNSFSFKFNVENSEAVKAEADNKGNAGNAGMPTGKSLNANGDPVHGVDVKLGMKKQDKELDKSQPTKSLDKELDKSQPTKSIEKKLDKNQPSINTINLPVERIIHDAEGNVVALATKAKNGSITVLVKEAQLLAFSKKQAVKLKMTDADYLSALQNYLQTGNTRVSGPGVCWVWVNCNIQGHPPGCGGMEPVICDPGPIFK